MTAPIRREGRPSSRDWIKRALLLIVVGLLVQLFCLVHVTPHSFLTFAGVGLGLVFAGLVAFVIAVRRTRADEAEVDRGD